MGVNLFSPGPCSSGPEHQSRPQTMSNACELPRTLEPASSPDPQRPAISAEDPIGGSDTEPSDASSDELIPDSKVQPRRPPTPARPRKRRLETTSSSSKKLVAEDSSSHSDSNSESEAPRRSPPDVELAGTNYLYL